MKRIIATLTFFFCSCIFCLCRAQTVSDVSVRQEGNKVIVSYRLDKPSEMVDLRISTDGGKTFSGPLKQVSGDVVRVGAGHHSIIWDVLAERENLVGNDIVFNLRAVSNQYVDLGLSVKWATCNLGASKPEEYGKYFAWGDVVGQTWDGSIWSDCGFSTYPTYQLDANYNLKPEYDAAHILLGGNWRMPTEAECQELIDNCTRIWTSNYNGTGVAGRIFTSKKKGYTGKSIFLPAAGFGLHSYLRNAGSDGYYWSSTFYYDHGAVDLDFSSGNVYSNGYSRRNDGLSVRPVSE